MSFTDAVTTVITKKYADFSGRARRSEYWWFYLAVVLVGVVFSVLGQVADLFTILYYVVLLALLVPFIAVGVRRLHDTGKSGWFLLIGLIPIVGTIILIVFFVQDSNPGDNQYGANPKALAAPYGA
jgi:uncharacterized membrane protein YhaH (DUF805 family)